jgi:hypothetical protein
MKSFKRGCIGVKARSNRAYKKVSSKAIRWQDKKLKLKNRALGHLVLRRVANLDTTGKLQVKWEGPFLESTV